MPNISRGVATVTTALLGVLVLLTTLPTWVRGTTPTATGDLEVVAAGTSASPATASVALMILAAGLVLGLSGRGMRVIAISLVVLGSIGAGVTIVGFLKSPDTVAASAAADVTSVKAINSPVHITVWPYIALAICALTVVWMLWLATHVGQWQQVGRRFQTASPQVALEPEPEGIKTQVQARRQAMDDWDAISRGEDPT